MSILHFNRTLSVCMRAACGVVLTMTPLLVAETHTVTEPRPVYELVKVLERTYGWRVTYEDPPFESRDELKDVTSSAYSQTHPAQGDILLVPSAKAFTFSWSVSGRTGDRKAVLDQCVNEHNSRSGNPGQFRTYHQGGVSHVIPSASRNRDGAIVGTNSVLETRVSFPGQQRTLLDTISLIFDLVQRQTGARILVGTIPGSATTEQIPLAANQVSARDALLLALNAYDAMVLGRGLAPLRMSWALLYQADQQIYYLNLHPTHPKFSSDILIGPR